MGRKTFLWIYQAINKQNLTRENLDMDKKWKTLERNRNSSNRSIKQCHKDKLC